MPRGDGATEGSDFGMRSRVAVRPAGQDLLLAKGRLRGEPPTEFNWVQVSRRGVAVRRAEDNSSCARLAPSTGVQKARTVS